jgi:hypothetical protein
MDKTAAAMLMFAVGFAVPLSAAETAQDRASVRDRPVQHDQGCMSLDRYNRAAAEATRRTDWGSVPDAASIPEGTRSLMGEFVVYKDMQRSRTPPCPDLAEAHPEVRAIAPPTVAAVRSAAPPGLPKKTQSVLAPRPVIVSQNAFIRKEPSGSAEIVWIAKRRRETDRLLYAVRLDAGRKSESERMDRRRAAAAVIQRLFCAQQDSLSYGIEIVQPHRSQNGVCCLQRGRLRQSRDHAIFLVKSKHAVGISQSESNCLIPRGGKDGIPRAGQS